MAKPKTFEEAQAAFDASKEALKTAKEELREFRVENKLKNDQTPEDAKLAKKLEGLNKKVETAKANAEAARDAVKELKPKKERDTKYVYPEGMTDKDKKKFRAKARRDGKGGEKKEGDKKENGEGKEEKPAKKQLPKKEKTEDED